MKAGSLFSGVGGLDLGLERAGMEIVWQVEIDGQCRDVLRHNGHATIYEDVHDVGTDELSPVNLICGGFPCQDYSVAGKGAGLAGDRGALWWEMHRIVAECRPTWVVGENVPGLLSSRGGRDFLVIVGSLVELGYGVCWATLDSQFFGVPQRRRRLFIVGHSGGRPRPEILALSEGLYGHPAPSREAGKRVAASLTRGADSSGKGRHAGRRREDDMNLFVAPPLVASGRGTERVGESRGQDPIVVAHTLRAEGADASEDGTGRGTPIVAFMPESVHRDGTHVDGAHHPLRVSATPAIAFDTTQVTSASNYSNPRPGDPCHPLAARAHAPAIAHTLRQNWRNNSDPMAEARMIVGPVPRRLTPTECERLQAWPDDWTRWGKREDGEVYELKDSPRYRMVGNGVTASVAEWIGHRIMATTEAPDG